MKKRMSVNGRLTCLLMEGTKDCLNLDITHHRLLLSLFLKNKSPAPCPFVMQKPQPRKPIFQRSFILNEQ
jgi:hypothetical protein